MKKNKNNLRRVLIVSIILMFLWISGIYLYTTYNNIEINNDNYKVTRLQSTMEAQTVEKVEEKSKTIADIIEETNRKVVGISKLKEPGSSILSKSSESELGLGTGFIVSENGYILSNEHVTDSKYSKCYVTLENGNNYDGSAPRAYRQVV